MHHELDKLEHVKQAFNDWRQIRPKQSKIPTELWALVKPLINEYPISMICRTLKVSSTQIKNNVTKKNIINEDAIFVEAIKPAYNQKQTNKIPTNFEQTCDIELQRPCGSILKINSLPVSVASNLIPSFLGERCYN